MPKLQRQTGLDLISVTPSTVFNHPGLGTTAFRIGDFTPATNPAHIGIRQIQITNEHAVNRVNFGLSSNATSVTFGSAASGSYVADNGIVVLPMSQYFLNIKSDMTLWLKASAASTVVQVAVFDFNVA